MKYATIILYSILLAPLAAQGTGSPRFEVASVKPTDPDTPHMVGIHVYPGGRVETSGLTLKTLIGAAFDVGNWQVSGGEEWVARDTYFIEAKPPEARQAGIQTFRYTLFGIDDPVLRQMLQALLIDRFQLKFHRETKTADVYALSRNAKPLAAQPARLPAGVEDDNAFGSIGYVGGKWSIFATSMAQLARFASGIVLHAPVIDRTGLEGAFDYRQRQPDLDPHYGGDQSDSFRAFLSETGFQLERSKGAVEIFVIDAAARPSAN